MVLATLAEHSLPFTFALVMVKLAQVLAADKALSGLRLSRTSAAYKMVHGLGYTFSERIFNNSQKYQFSITPVVLCEAVRRGWKQECDKTIVQLFLMLMVIVVTIFTMLQRFLQLLSATILKSCSVTCMQIINGPQTRLANIQINL